MIAPACFESLFARTSTGDILGSYQQSTIPVFRQPTIWVNASAICETIADVNRGVRQVTLDGKVLPGNEIPFLDDGGQYQIQVLMD